MNDKLYDIETIVGMNKLYKTLLDEVDTGIHVINKNSKTIVYNRKMAEIESMDRDDVLHKNLLDVFSFHGKQNSTLIETLHTGQVKRRKKQTYFNNKGKEITTINDSFPIKNKGEIVAVVEIAKDVTQLERMIKENVLQKKNSNFTFDQIIGDSEPMQAVIEEAKRATRTASSVLIVGDTGTGKELFAQSIHNGSHRSSGPFISQNCAAIPDSLMEGLLFGTKKGAFTGAVDRPGLFEQANGGTLLLDEINSLDLALQAKLLRAVQEKTIRRVGDMQEKKIDVRIIATMNEDPIDAINERRLRRDLYYRLSVVTLLIPSLNERKDDIWLLINHFIDKYNALFEMNVEHISEAAKAVLYQHHWPGNVRELEHTIEGTMNMIMDENVIDIANLPISFLKRYPFHKKHAQTIDRNIINFDNNKEEVQPLQTKMYELEKAYIQRVLEVHNHNISRTATKLGISRQSLQYRLKKFGL
ncbi:sigma-54-dependent Fis family transcriptional regulator [Virgibacillus profundi]|uniref:Sigma-54-dependent Fis family transcriptional regulator n=1 Tax=Virgibacillus profundi TaxID=2024555 RepID=A0A2A2I8Q2_9BACI|nr:sigma 54-interacting transcriptional regulator [Virgibacillus profundi]PAV28391.1 sigma-54-dependent Fis family transcriptional regulator [Virgibacillus profundi]PXY52247.1 PAS domain S-box protein [Virgibacillus profundi]